LDLDIVITYIFLLYKKGCLPMKGILRTLYRIPILL